jgi:nucleotide-binding universal stress UspA family protein
MVEAGMPPCYLHWQAGDQSREVGLIRITKFGGRVEAGEEQNTMKRLLIAIDGSANDTASLASAMLVARRLSAEISVVHTALQANAVYAAGDLTVVADDSDEAAAAARRARAAYDAVCADWPGAKWSMTEESSAELISRLGPLADLVIMERLSEEHGPAAASLNAALFETAGPVLITTPEPPAEIAANPVIAWNATTQAAAAVKSAMALLQSTGRVTVLSGGDVSTDSLNRLAEYLGAYGKTMTVERFSSDQLTARGRARALLKAVDGLAADLLIMGAYGENAVDALFGLGRATQKIVTAARIPVFLQR